MDTWPRAELKPQTMATMERGGELAARTSCQGKDWMGVVGEDTCVCEGTGIGLGLAVKEESRGDMGK